MDNEHFPQEPKAPKPKKKARGNRTLTIIFYTLYCILIAAFLAGLYFVNVRLEETLVQYEESHITVQAEAAFQAHFADPDWAALYEMAGTEDTLFEDASDYAFYMEGAVGNQELTYSQVTAADTYLCQVMAGSREIGTFSMADRRETGAKWPSWQLNAITLTVPREITVQIRKLDTHTVTVNGIPLDESYTQQIDTLLAAEYTLPGTDGISTHLQQVSGFLLIPDIRILDEAGNLCPLVQDPETGVYEEQLPEPVALTPEQEQIARNAANAWGTYLLRSSSEGNLSLYFNSREPAYQSILSSSFWVDAPGGYTTESVDILASQVYGDDHFSAYVSCTAKQAGTDSQIAKSATLFFELTRNGWTCYEIQPGNVYTDISKVRLEFWVDGTEIFYDYFETDRAALYVPLVTAPEGHAFAGWGTENADGSMNLVFTPDETGYVSLPQGTVLEPMVLHAIFEPTEGGT